jgi:branched-chain amino acid transport system permease protein
VRMFLQLLVDGLFMGLVYVLMSTGFNLVMSVANIIYLAFGEFYMLGAFGVWYLEVPGHLNYFLAVILTVIGTAVLGALTYLLVYRPLQYEQNQFLTNFIAGIGLMLIIGQGALLTFGTTPRGVPEVFKGIIDAWGVRISVDRLMILGLAVTVLIFLHAVLQWTRIGRALRAVSFRSDIASLQGINADRMFLATVTIGCALAGFAGAVMAPLFGIDLGMGANGGFLVLLVVILGGVGSMPGAILAGLVFGEVLSFGQAYIGSGQAQIFFFVVIAIILLIRPQGLLGKKTKREFGSV